MKEIYKNTAEGFLEFASEQRLAILLAMLDKSVKISAMAKELESTVPEVFRNFERLLKADLIYKNSDGSYSITAIGKALCSQVPLMRFLSKNKIYFKNHDFAELPTKFIQRLGALENGKTVKGFVKVLEKWKEINSEADKYIYNILVEVPYSPDIMEPLFKKVNSGVKLRSIFSESAIVPHERKQVVDKMGFSELIKQGKIERKMKKSVKTVIILNEKEAGVMFPETNDDADVSEAFFSKDPDFHEWCLDYFEYCWQDSGPFREIKFKE